MHTKDSLAKPMPVDGNKLQSYSAVAKTSFKEWACISELLNCNEHGTLQQTLKFENEVTSARCAPNRKHPAFFPWLKECINTKFVPRQPYVSSSSCTINNRKRETLHRLLLLDHHAADARLTADHHHYWSMTHATWQLKTKTNLSLLWEKVTDIMHNLRKLSRVKAIPGTNSWLHEWVALMQGKAGCISTHWACWLTEREGDVGRYGVTVDAGVCLSLSTTPRQKWE